MNNLVTVQMLDENENVSFSVSMPSYIKGISFDASLKSEQKATTFFRDNFKEAVACDKVEEFLKNTLATTAFGQLYTYTAIANLGLGACLKDKRTSDIAIGRIEKAMRNISEVSFAKKYLMYVLEEVFYRVNKQRCPYSEKYQVQVFTKEERDLISNEAFANNIEKAIKDIKKENI